MAANEVHTGDWAAQYEQLSAYADGELGAPASAVLEAHLAACDRCQTALADLRALKAVLSAIPAPAPGRSFAIPDDVPAPVARSSGTPVRAARGRPAPGRGVGLARVAQWLGGIAAAAGLVLLFGAALLHSPVGNLSTASAPRYGAAAPRTNAAATQASSGGPSATQPPNKTSAAPEGTPTPAPTSPTPASRSQSPATSDAGSAGTQPPVAPIAGATLIIAGGGAFLAGRRAERRGRRAEA